MIVTLSSHPDPPVPLEVTISPAQPNPFTLTEGEDLLLRCTVAEGAEVTTITWFRDSLPVSEGVSSGSEGLLLSIVSVQVCACVFVGSY